MLISKDGTLSESRALALAGAGFAALKASTITSAAGLAVWCGLAIIDTTFESKHHKDFVERVRGDNPNLILLSLRTGAIEPDMLIKAVRDCLEANYDGPRVVVIDNRATTPRQEHPF